MKPLRARRGGRVAPLVTLVVIVNLIFSLGEGIGFADILSR